MNIRRTLVLLPLASLGLFATDLKFEAQGSALVGNGDLVQMNDDKRMAGFSLGVAAHLLKEGGLGFRLHLNRASIKGAAGTGMENGTLAHTFGGLDITQQFGKAMLFGGLMGTRWQQDMALATNPEFADVVGGKSYNNAGKGTKLGFRIGVEYALTPKLSAAVSFTQTEFNKVYQPSWLALGVNYRFN